MFNKVRNIVEMEVGKTVEQCKKELGIDLRPKHKRGEESESAIATVLRYAKDAIKIK